MALYHLCILLAISTMITCYFLPTDSVPEMEKGIAQFLHRYVGEQREKLDALEKQAAELEKRSESDTDLDADQDPTQTFLKVKALSVEWENILEDIDSDDLPMDESSVVPTQDDLEESAAAIFRIQDFYSMSIADVIALGNNPDITANQCFDIGLTAYEMSDYYHSLMWFMESDFRLATEAEPNLDEIDLLPPLIVSMYEQGNRYHASQKLIRLKEIFENMTEIERNEILESGWLTGSDHSLVDTLKNRVGSITGLDVTNAESLQMNRYVAGGRYSVHWDNYFVYGDKPERFGNDRIATFMYYLSDSKGGGATVFPQLNLSIFPSKNDAVFWYNLDKSGKRINGTLHGGCPLVSGIKWVANQWLREGGQEFLRRCGLGENE